MTSAKMTYAIPEPMPGVWEVRLQDVEDTRNFDWQQAKKPEHVPTTAVTITVSALDVGRPRQRPLRVMAGGQHGDGGRAYEQTRRLSSRRALDAHGGRATR